MQVASKMRICVQPRTCCENMWKRESLTHCTATTATTATLQDISAHTCVWHIINLHKFLVSGFFVEQVSKRERILSKRLTLLGRPSTAHSATAYCFSISSTVPPCSSAKTILALHHSIIFIPFTEDRRKENWSKKLGTKSQLDAIWTQTCLAHGIVKTTRTNYVTRCEALGQDCWIVV